jgi:hypothetical protein
MTSIQRELSQYADLLTLAYESQILTWLHLSNFKVSSR